MEIVKTPWHEKFIDLTRKARHSIKIASPFVTASSVNSLLNNKLQTVSFELVTNYKITSICTGSLDISALINIVERKGSVKNYQALHAKIYIFDDEKAIISSGNFTNGGMITNFEYGVLVENQDALKTIVNDYKKLSVGENIPLEGLLEAKELAQNISKSDKSNFSLSTKIEEGPELAIPAELILKNLSGWRADIFSCIARMPTDKFNKDDFKIFYPELQQKHQDNTHIQEKIRQQLQELRDLGLVEFTEVRGVYRKLWQH